MKEHTPSKAPISDAEREVFIATELKKTQERVNWTFTKYLHAKTIEQASDSILGNLPSDNQHTPPDTEENVVVTPDDDMKFNEMVNRLILQN
jgi:hypothetical protein